MQKELLQDKQILVFHPKASLCFISRGRVMNVQFEEITFITRRGGYAFIYTIVGSYQTSMSLQEILYELPVNEFFRINRCQAISLRFMDGAKDNKIKLGKQLLTITNYYKAKLIARLGEILDNYQPVL